MASKPQSDCSLLQLPESCLLAVLRCCADDPRSLFSAARTHSRLHQAAVLAASSITAVLQFQRQADGVLLYLRNHGQHVSSINLSVPVPADDGIILTPQIGLRELPQNLSRLESLHLRGLHVQLQPGDGFKGVLRAVMPLKQLQLDTCELLDGPQLATAPPEEALAAALALLPSLQHLSMGDSDGREESVSLSSSILQDILQALQQLTFLELAAVELQDPDSLQHLQGLTCLQELRLDLWSRVSVSASTLSGAQQLTRLQLRGSPDEDMGCCCEPAALAGKTQLQHLALQFCILQGGSAGVTELLSHLQHMQQLSHLDLRGVLESTAPAAAYAALTASSKLQHLDISECKLAAEVWQHMFPVGRRLPHLRMLDVGYVAGPAAAPEGSRLVSCCPGLQSLWVKGLQYSADLLAPLTGMGALEELYVDSLGGGSSSGGLEALCQLTKLKQLWLQDGSGDEEVLWPLTQLKQLTQLQYIDIRHGEYFYKKWIKQAPSDEPVWRQVLRDYLNHEDPEVAQRAAAALAETDDD